ncbi:hypothetical protein [Oribacterium sp. oral taxon 078]|nr:hypothetical protein [Oribacterium sp. oral taxon 078]
MRKDRGEIQKAQKVQRRKLAVKEGKAKLKNERSRRRPEGLH